MVRLFIVVVTISFFQTSAQKLPLANQKVVEYVQSVMGTQVGTGECTDLLMMALFQIRNIEQPPEKKNQKQVVLPGDFIGFDYVSLGGLSFPDHRAIILEVEAPNVYIIAHQNHNGNRTVTQLRLDLNQPYQGKISISRPKYNKSKAQASQRKKKKPLIDLPGLFNK